MYGYRVLHYKYDPCPYMVRYHERPLPEEKCVLKVEALVQLESTLVPITGCFLIVSYVNIRWSSDIGFS